MPEVIIKYKSPKTLLALLDIAKYFDFTVKPKKQVKQTIKSTEKRSLPIVFSETPDIEALAGIWKDKNVTLSELREKAWGGRFTKKCSLDVNG